MTSQPAAAGDRPLSPAAKAMLIVTASATILLCYVFSTLSIILLLLLLGIEALMMVVGARFGFAFLFVNLMKRHAPLTGMFVRSFWLSSGTDYNILLQRADAPKFFALLDHLSARLAIAVPHEVAIEMHAGAWVRLHGYRRGAGRTTLGVGYDLLAGLTESEVEAVLAHEMAHAKLVHRGLKNWLSKGVSRSAMLTRQLAERCEAFRAAKQTSTLTSGFRRISELLTATAARLVAAYSRQDEFEADRGAAELCGSAPLRSSLRRLEAMEEKLARMPWRERVAQLELEGSFSAWLMAELKSPATGAETSGAAHVRDPYSTHPSLPDRIAALPADDGRPQIEAPGIGLLADPDRVARDLMRQIQRVIGEQEQKDTKSLSRWARKTQRTSNIRWAQAPAIIVVFVGVFWGIGALAAEFHAGQLITAAIFAGAVYLWRWGRYRDPRPLPVPRFAALKRAWEAERPPDLPEREKVIEEELNAAVANERKSRRKLALLIDAAYAALDECDYLRAHVASRLGVQIDKKSVEAGLALAVASGSFGDGEQVGSLLRFVIHHTALASPSTRWGGAWALLLVGDWNAAEALLWQLHEQQPDEPTFLCLLALAQAERNKLQSAIMNARRAVTLTHGDTEAVKLLARVLLDAGRLQEAGEQLAALQDMAPADAEISMLQVRWHLARREFERAAEWSEALRRVDGSVASQLRLAAAFEAARHDDTAAQIYEHVLTVDFYPEAHLGLARVASRRRDKTNARQQLFAALNFERTVGARGTGPGPLFHAILSQLMLLEDRRERCEAWVVTLPIGFNMKSIAGRSFIVFAADRADAEKHFAALLAAMQPGGPPPLVNQMTWELAPKDRQPDRPVYPGVQGML